MLVGFRRECCTRGRGSVDGVRWEQADVPTALPADGSILPLYPFPLRRGRILQRFSEACREAGALMKSSMRKSCVFACLLEDGEALAAQVLLRGRDSQIGNGFHGLTMEYGFGYFI